MSLIAPIVRMARRLRLQAAETDLAFLEARAPIVIAEQRAHVARLRHRAGLCFVSRTLSADQIRAEIERQAKQVLL
jgi:hypothetical protein